MEPQDVADQIRELEEEQVDARRARAAERAAEARKERFRRLAALTISVLAMLLAVNSLGGENATKEMVNANILASDSWAFYQAKNVRQTGYRLAADQLEALLPTLPAEGQAAARQKLDGYRATIARYESEPDPAAPDDPLRGEGKRELQARAQYWERRRDHAQRQDPSFDYAGALLQIGIVLGSVAILAVSRPVLAIGVVLGALGALLMLNGFFLWFDLPLR
jgi:hypothetical protein